MKEYLGFVDEIGRTSQGGYIYRLDFTANINDVWGDKFNEAPAIMVPTLTPDENCLTSRAKAVFPREMHFVKKSSCFSIQDCIDGIIALMFSEIDDDTLEIDNVPFFLNFGEEKESVEEKLKKIGVELYDIENVVAGDSSAIDEIIDGDILDDDSEGDDYDF